MVSHQFQIKLNTKGSNLNFRFASENGVELFLLEEVLTKKFKSMELVHFLEKNQTFHTPIQVAKLKMTLWKTMRQNRI
jgi:hypothetical protein